jgi:hypothetical protein
MRQVYSMDYITAKEPMDPEAMLLLKSTFVPGESVSLDKGIYHTDPGYHTSPSPLAPRNKNMNPELYKLIYHTDPGYDTRPSPLAPRIKNINPEGGRLHYRTDILTTTMPSNTPISVGPVEQELKPEDKPKSNTALLAVAAVIGYLLMRD